MNANFNKLPKTPQQKLEQSIRWRNGILAFFIGIIVIGSCSAPNTKTATRAPDKFDAHVTCEKAFKLASKDPDKAEIPYIDPVDYSNYYHFTWNQSSKMIRMRNGLGFDVAATGSCSINKVSMKPTKIELDGRTLFGG